MTTSRPLADTPSDRLADRILFALQLAVAQKDLAIAENLARSLELSMTRRAGGADFVERRDFPAEAEQALTALSALKAAQK